MDLNELNVYQIAQEIGENIWEIVKTWKYFEKETFGKQLTRAADSIAANIAEGFGRFHYSENRLFCFYVCGFIKTWLTKSFYRKLISEDQYNSILKSIDDLSIRLNNYIKSINNLSAVKEPQNDYPKLPEPLNDYLVTIV